jgi:hypothetical protein
MGEIKRNPSSSEYSFVKKRKKTEKQKTTPEDDKNKIIDINDKLADEKLMKLDMETHESKPLPEEKESKEISQKKKDIIKIREKIEVPNNLKIEALKLLEDKGFTEAKINFIKKHDSIMEPLNNGDIPTTLRAISLEMRNLENKLNKDRKPPKKTFFKKIIGFFRKEKPEPINRNFEYKILNQTYKILKSDLAPRPNQQMNLQ